METATTKAGNDIKVINLASYKRNRTLKKDTFQEPLYVGAQRMATFLTGVMVGIIVGTCLMAILIYQPEKDSYGRQDPTFGGRDLGTGFSR